MFYKIMMIVLLLLICFLIIAGYYQTSKEVRINHNGILGDFKYFEVIDQDDKYLKGQYYKINHKFFYGQVIDTNIERID